MAYLKRCNPKQASHARNWKERGEVKEYAELSPRIAYQWTVLLLPRVFCGVQWDADQAAQGNCH